jgi:hypothetical protein
VTVCHRHLHPADFYALFVIIYIHIAFILTGVEELKVKGNIPELN